MGQIYIFKGKKHGTGKEYCKIGSVIFEGNYKYWLKNGLRKEFKYQTLHLEGEHSNNKRKGNGIEYDETYNDIIFQGEFVNNERIIKKILIYHNKENTVDIDMNSEW